MDGVGSTRLGRATARYGSTAVFNGPVRKWVYVSPSSTVKHSQSNGSSSNSSATTTTGILLCRWTPLSSADSGSSVSANAVDGDDEEQPPKRKFRYTPVAVLEEEWKRVAAKQVEDEAKRDDENETKQSPAWLSSKSGNDLNMNQDLKKETQESNIGNLDLGLCLKSHDDPRLSIGEKAGSSAGFRDNGLTRN